MADPSPLWGRGAGYRLLRYLDNEVLGNTDGVLQHIIKAVNHPHPSPLPERERENTLRGGKRETAVDGDPRLNEFRTRFLPKLVAEFHPTLVLAFGSRVRGEGLAHSDLDLLIVSELFQDVRWLDRPVQVVETLDLSFGVDLLCYTPEEY